MEHWVTKALRRPCSVGYQAFEALDKLRETHSPQTKPTPDPPGIVLWLLAGKSRDEVSATFLLLRAGLVQEAGPHTRLIFENFINAALIAPKLDVFEERFLDFRFVLEHEWARRAGFPIPPDTKRAFDQVRKNYQDSKGKLFEDWTGRNWFDKSRALGPSVEKTYRAMYSRTSGFSHSNPQYLYDWQLSYRDPEEGDALILAHASETMLFALEFYYWTLRVFFDALKIDRVGLDLAFDEGVKAVKQAFTSLLPTQEQLRQQWKDRFGHDYPGPIGNP